VTASFDPTAPSRAAGLDQPVRLSVPASMRYLSAARVVAASLGAEGGLDVDDLDDLRLGVNELLSLLVESSGPGARIELEFAVGDGTISVRGTLEGAAAGQPVEIDELTRRIVDAVLDHHELDGTSFSLIKATSLRDHG
jgi:anti-sigma regulatory factor (Ser/Thr protein kinase)